MAGKMWEKVPISKVYEALYDGPHATPKPASDGPVFLGIKNITDDGKFDFSEVRHIAEEDFSNWTRRVLPRPGDIVFTYEATLNRYAIIREGFRGCLGRRLALIRPDKTKVDTQFLFYSFFSADWRQTIASKTMSGSTVDRIPLITFPTFPISLPPLPTQRKIAAILSAYDDLIENNTRRIQILEDMARSLYHEWFVQFRFPGHENTPMVESALGLIPEGWQVQPFSSTAEFINGFAFAPRHWKDEGMPIIKIAELKNGVTTKTPRNNGESIPAKYHLRNGDILFSWSADLEVYIWGHGKALLNQHLFKVAPRKLFRDQFIFLSLKDKMQEFRNRSNGTTMKHIKRSALDDVSLAVPSNQIMDDFEKYASPLAQQSINLKLKNENLRKTRDLLLPRLISGELDVSGLEIVMGVEKEESGQ